MAKKKTDNETVEVQSEEVVEQPVTPEVKVAPEPAEKADVVEPKEEVKEKTVEELADEVDRGVHGSGRERMIVLGSRYAEVQAEVNRRYKESIRL